MEKGPEGVLLAAGTQAQRVNAAQASSGKGKQSGGSKAGSAGSGPGLGASGASGSGPGSSGGPGAAGSASTGSSNAQQPVCTWSKSHVRSGKGHNVDSCYSKKFSDMGALFRSGGAAGNAAVSSSRLCASPTA